MTFRNARLWAKHVCLLAAFTGWLSAGAQAQDIERAGGETDIAFATRALDLAKDSQPHVVSATWGGRPTLFVDYETAGEDSDRPLMALQQQPSGGYRALPVTIGEHEGALPQIAIGFVPARSGHTQKLIVLLSWEQRHYDFSGTMYEVRLFENRPGTAFAPLNKLSQHFGMVCDCRWRDGTSKRYRFKTIAAVKAELKRLGH